MTSENHMILQQRVETNCKDLVHKKFLRPCPSLLSPSNMHQLISLHFYINPENIKMIFKKIDVLLLEEFFHAYILILVEYCQLKR